MKSLVSIIIPSFNSEQKLPETLESVVNQTYLNWECIVVDDGSTDETTAVVKGYCEKDNRFKSFIRPVHKLKGPSSCRNYGLELAKGDYIIFLDSDDLLAPFCLEERIKAFEANKKSDFLVFQMERFLKRPNLHSNKPLKKLNTQCCISSFLQLKSVWQITSPIYKKEFLIKIKGFNEKLENFEDLELAIKAIFNSSVFKLFNNIDSFYRNDENYITKYNSKILIKKSIEAFIILIKSLHKDIIAKCKNKQTKVTYSQDIVIAYKMLFLKYIKENVKEFKTQNRIIINFLSSNNYLTNKQIFIFFFTQNILFKFYKIKGLGLFKFMKYLYQ
jgi:glycosyltransferase involved in cell wall biosynthesis